MPGGIPAAHPVNSAARRRGGRAKIDSFEWRLIGIAAQDGTNDQLLQIGPSAIDVATDKIWIGGLQVLTCFRCPFQNAILESGRKPFDLFFHSFGHVERGARWNMAIGPRRVFSCRGAAGIKPARLCDQNKRILRMRSSCDLFLRSGDFLQRSADMDCPGSMAIWITPWNR